MKWMVQSSFRDYNTRCLHRDWNAVWGNEVVLRVEQRTYSSRAWQLHLHLPAKPSYNERTQSCLMPIIMLQDTLPFHAMMCTRKSRSRLIQHNRHNQANSPRNEQNKTNTLGTVNTVKRDNKPDPRNE